MPNIIDEEDAAAADELARVCALQRAVKHAVRQAAHWGRAVDRIRKTYLKAEVGEDLRPLGAALRRAQRAEQEALDELDRLVPRNLRKRSA